MRNVLIFGTNRGIGLALVKKYLAEGDRVYALCREASDDLKKTKATIIEGVDITNFKRVQEVAKELESEKFDIFIHNAGIWTDEEIIGAKEKDFQDMAKAFEVNSIAPLKTVSAFLSHFKKGAKIGLMSSQMGSIEDNSSGGRYAYRMSKAALNAAGKSLAVDLPDFVVALLHPGYVRTDMTKGNGFIDTPESADGLYQVLENVDSFGSGKLWNYRGEILPY